MFIMMSNEQQDKNFCSSKKNNATDKDQSHPQQACWQTVYLPWGGEIYLTIFKPLGTKKGLFHMLNINVLPWVLKGTLEDSNVINCKQFLDHRSNDVFKPLPSPCSLTSGIDLGTEHRLWWNVQYLSWLSWSTLNRSFWSFNCGQTLQDREEKSGSVFFSLLS